MNQNGRKINRIPGYDYSQNGAYFITICVQDRKQILSKITAPDACIILKPYGKVVEKYIQNTPEITKYVIMPDHIHLIIHLDGNQHARKITSIVRSIKVLTVKEIGQSIFQRSYYDHVVRNQKDYDEIWEYIDNNPQKWVLQHLNEEEFLD